MISDRPSPATTHTERPQAPAEWPVSKTIEILSRHVPDGVSKSRRVPGGGTARYIPWAKVCEILDKYAPGWDWEVTIVHSTSDRLFVTGVLTLCCADGTVRRSGSGTELLKELTTDRATGEIMEREISYGDPISNAEAQAFRKAAKKFGLGKDL